MKYNQIKREAKKHGWFLLREGSSHEIWAHPNKEFYIQLGRHDSEKIKTGLYQN